MGSGHQLWLWFTGEGCPSGSNCHVAIRTLFLRAAAAEKETLTWICAQAVGGEPQKDLLHH